MKIFNIFKSIWPYIAIIMIIVIFFFDTIFGGKSLYPFDILHEYFPWKMLFQGKTCQNHLISDSINFFYPMYHNFKLMIEHGTFSFWNSWNFGGKPFVPFSLYPYLYYYFFSTSVAHNIIIILHTLLSGIFMYKFLVCFKLHRMAILFGAIAWMFNGYLLVWLELEYTVMMAMTLPVTLLCIEKFIKSGRAYHFLLTVFIISLTFSIGYAHLLIYQLLFIGIYYIYRMTSLLNAKKIIYRDFFKRMVLFSTIIIISSVVSASFFTSHFYLKDESQRGTFKPSELFIEKGELPVSYLITLLFPDYFGNPADAVSVVPKTHIQQTYNNYNELCIYLGIPTIMFILLSFGIKGRSKEYLFFLICFLVILTIPMGSLIYYPLIRFVPGLAYSTPTRILYLLPFFSSIIAAFSFHALLTEKVSSIKTVIIISLIILVSIIFMYLAENENVLKTMIGAIGVTKKWPIVFFELSKYLKEYVFDIYLKQLILIFISGMCIILLTHYTDPHKKKILAFLIIIILTTDLMSFGRKYNTVTDKELEYPLIPSVEYLRRDPTQFRIAHFDLFLYNCWSIYGIEDAGGYSSFLSERFSEYFHLMQFCGDRPMPKVFGRWLTLQRWNSPLIDLMNIKYFILPPNLAINDPEIPLVYKNEVNIFYNSRKIDRIFFVEDYIQTTGKNDMFKKLLSFNREQFKNTVLLEDNPELELMGPASDTLSIFSYSTIAYNDDLISIKCKTDRPGLVVILDAFHKDWKVFLNDKPVKLLTANYIFRAVAIGVGESTITMRFRPTMLIIGLWISGIGWVILILSIIIIGAMDKRNEIINNNSTI